MGTVVDKLNYLKDTKSAIKNALVEKGVEVADSDTFRSYAQKVSDLSVGGEIDALIDGSITEIESNVESIRSYAFFRMNNLIRASFPNAKSIGVGAFNRCIELAELSLPLVEKIYVEPSSFMENSFYNCSKLTEISLPCVKILDSYAISMCTGLKKISAPLLTDIGQSCFYGCKNLTDLELPSLKTMGYYVFQNCSSLVEVSFNLVMSIKNYAFSGCTALVSAKFPLAKYIYYKAFEKCSNLTTLYIGIESDTVCNLDSVEVFNGCTSLTDIYVPEALVEDYKTATNWSNFADKIKAYTGETA